MLEEQIKKEDVVETAGLSRQLFGHEKDLAQIRKDIDQCYVRGSNGFREDVAGVVSDTIQKDDNRERIRKYARESAEEVWDEKKRDKDERGWKSKNLWIPVITGIVGVILGAFLAAYFTVQLSKNGQENKPAPTASSQLKQ